MDVYDPYEMYDWECIDFPMARVNRRRARLVQYIKQQMRHIEEGIDGMSELQLNDIADTLGALGRVTHDPVDEGWASYHYN